MGGMYRHTPLHHSTIVSFLFLLVISNSPEFRLLSAQGRRLAQTVDNYSKTVNEEDKSILRAQIGSRPPRCERRCSSCGHCEAIQVPTNPQTRNRGANLTSIDPTNLNNIAYARGDDSSNYKPMSWKCKCGNLIFNP